MVSVLIFLLLHQVLQVLLRFSGIPMTFLQVTTIEYDLIPIQHQPCLEQQGSFSDTYDSRCMDVRDAAAEAYALTPQYGTLRETTNAECGTGSSKGPIQTLQIL